MGVRAYADFGDFFALKKWRGTKLHEEVKELRSHVSRGPILTLAPIYPLEAGLAIYPSFSTGAFAWRISPYVEPAKAVRLGIVSPATLEQMLKVAPAAGVLVGLEKTGEQPLAGYAARNSYEAVTLADKSQLWVGVP
jgi:hypothetical protein